MLNVQRRRSTVTGCRRALACGGLAAVLVATLLGPSAGYAGASVSGDDPDGAVEISSLPFDVSGDLTGATASPADSQMGCGAQNRPTLWYRLEASSDGELATQLRGDQPVLALARVEDGSVEPVACASGQQSSGLNTNFVKGRTYLIMVGGDGSFTLHGELLAPVSFGGWVDDDGRFTLDGIAVADVYLTCSRPVELRVTLTLNQAQPLDDAHGAVVETMSCDGSGSPQPLRVVPDGGQRFLPGQTQGSSSEAYCLDDGCFGLSGPIWVFLGTPELE